MIPGWRLVAGVGYLGVGAPEARIKCAHIWQAIEQRLHVSADKVTMVRATVRETLESTYVTQRI